MICKNVVDDNVANLGYSFIGQFDKTAHLNQQTGRFKKEVAAY